MVLDAPHDAAAIEAAVAGRRVVAICCTHAHDDHVNVAPELRRLLGAPILLHPDDHVLWRLAHETEQPDRELADRQRIEVAGTYLEVLHTPGHAPGGVCFLAPEIGTVFSGDTLFAGGPGATGRSYSDFPTIIESIREPLADAAAIDRRPHRARRLDEHRRRGAAAAGLDRAWSLTPERGVTAGGSGSARRRPGAGVARRRVA